MYRQNKTTGKKCLVIYVTLSIFSLFSLIQANGQTDDLDHQLIRAAKNGDDKKIIELISSGADVNSTDIAGFTPLICAAKNGHIKCAKILLENGAFINSQCNQGCSSLMWAADSGHTEIVKVLIDNGATLNAKDFYGWTALMKARFIV